MTTCKQRSIVLVSFPFSNLASKKVRPVLVLSKNSYNKTSSDILVCALTTNLAESMYSVIVDADDMETKRSLKHRSRIKVDTIAALEKSLLLKQIAVLKKNIFDRVIEKLIMLVN